MWNGVHAPLSTHPWLSVAPIPALGLRFSSIEFRAALKYKQGVKLYDNEQKCPFVNLGL